MKFASHCLVAAIVSVFGFAAAPAQAGGIGIDFSRPVKEVLRPITNPIPSQSHTHPGYTDRPQVVTSPPQIDPVYGTICVSRYVNGQHQGYTLVGHATRQRAPNGYWYWVAQGFAPVMCR